jgi:hypothetical protein
MFQPGRVHASVAGLVLLSLGACSGAIEPEDVSAGPGPSTPVGRGGSSATGGRGGTSGGQGNGAAGSGGTQAPVMRPAGPACMAVDPGPSVYRRLTRWEYHNAIRDIGLGLPDNQNPTADFPTEEKLAGFTFDNNASALTVSPLLSEQYLSAADRIATNAVLNATTFRTVLGGCDPAMRGEDACFTSFVTTLGKRIYRRPPSTEEIAILREVYLAGKVTDFATGIRLALTTMLQSPRFLYRVEVGVPPKAGETVVRLDPYEIATRLSFVLWGTAPDSTLIREADANRLSTPKEIADQVNRMLFDTAMDGTKTPHSRLRRNFAHLNDQWLEIEKILEIEKDTKVFPKFDKSLLSLFRSETTRFLEHVILNGEGDLTTMLTAKYTFVDDRLAKFYGNVPVPEKPAMGVTPFTRVDLDGRERGGLLTQAGILAMLSNANQASPVHRGVFVRQQLLCQMLPPPPNDVMIELPQLDPKLTTRERFTRHREDPSCKGCHELIDPIGLGFENYDGIGLFRTAENGKPIDSSGEVVGFEQGKFKGVRELQQKLAESDDVRDCVVRQYFRYAFGRMEDDTVDACTLAHMRKRFADSGYKFRDLLVAITETDAFLYKRVVQPGGAQ